MSSAFIQSTANGVVVSVYVQPRASVTAFVGVHGDIAFKVRVAAPPVDGAANEAMCRFLADQFKIPRYAVDVLSGAASRIKRVRLLGVSVEAVEARFLNRQA